MPRYIEKPKELEAVQFTKEFILMTDWLKDAVNNGLVMFKLDDDNEMYALVRSNDGNEMIARFGDYIIDDPEYGIWAMPQKHFESRFEKAD